MNIFLLAAKNSIFVKTYSHFRMWITSGILIFSLEEKKERSKDGGSLCHPRSFWPRMVIKCGCIPIKENDLCTLCLEE